MKRILQVVGSMNRAGAETMVMNLYRAIDREKFQFDFIYFTKKECAFDKEIISLGGRIFHINEKDSKSPFLRTLQLYKIIKKEGPFHAVHCHQLFSNAFHLMAAYMAGIKMRIAHSHNTSDANSSSILGRIYQRLSKWIINLLGTDFVACGDLAGKYLFYRSREVLLIPNAIDIDKFIFSQEKVATDYFKLPEVDDNTLFITQIGRLMPVKNHKFSIEFADFLKSKNIDFRMLFIGGGELESELKNLVENKGLTSEVAFLGVRSDIDQVLANSDIMIMPSHHEGFPVILVEAQVAGCPSLISNNISPEVDLKLNLIEFCGLDESMDTWLGKMNELTKRPKTDERLIRETMRKEGFDIDVSVKRLERLYEKK
ncbi:glycosyltransferase family 1 protein [Muriicola marianensis]|uniref:Glycosyltransferase EpsF n=1 Tax=Muriicola marianensis TaxID=1324801 RepID=A0ABQ1QT46_9FLAO|nr:glycosyltransferase family 1 protein [Muriicola marianensis]GGD40955.1 putative glycosyltransferase EpsF [Muriicola marianensis]